MIIKWDYMASVDRSSRLWTAKVVSTTALEAWEDAYARLDSIRKKARFTLYRVDEARLNIEREW